MPYIGSSTGRAEAGAAEPAVTLTSAMTDAINIVVGLMTSILFAMAVVACTTAAITGATLGSCVWWLGRIARSRRRGTSIVESR